MGLSSASGSSTSGGSSSGGPKMRSKTGQGRPRPKTIHIDSGADSHPGTITPSRDKKGSSSNLSGKFCNNYLIFRKEFLILI